MESNFVNKSPSVLLKDLSKVLLESSKALEAKKKTSNAEQDDIDEQDDINDKSGKLNVI